MKMTDKHYQELESRINVVLQTESGKTYYALCQVCNFSDVRYVWDMYHAANNQDNFSFQDELYTYLNDNHIYTALKQILTPYMIKD